ncbi:YezD family protein [Sphingomonas sp. C3-2]|uniref:YezD family protein n=1 Tax=Sphingomonas sp. C3-2 TaxID=3062169 RepID=UPI00294B277E|nr:YezD family protein [Sphingomonas sp. C3-2]WOK35117.1 YezD family protein [Sphingomonas sp. C3-2]
MSVTPVSERDMRIDAVLEKLMEALDSVRFGNVVLTVHDGRVVQLDITEKHRFAP